MTEIKPISLETSNNIERVLELQKLCKDWYRDEVEKLGIPEAWGGAPLSNEEIDKIHREFLIKYGML